MNPGRKEIAEKLRHYRESCALSQQQVADALNIERSTYTKYETGKSDPNIKTLVKIAKIFNIDPVELLPTESSDDERVTRLRDVTHADSPIFQLSKDERGLIAKYRTLSREEKKLALEMMGNLSKKDK
ncbi:MAG: helix-turn-helix transcriptional regulator [Ruminococcus sp.]|uniref:helix-turn-helix domain-containing protein n=1 Tax=Ruminococcus sp. TaxID=41978 RepID=UPI00287369AA|nr:helix-turn-helix transcriptional regulator [Ruminococcus sp.]MBQ3285084.1 helix-turn-helix transcriptional regulator [Ruminococcus sp.]